MKQPGELLFVLILNCMRVCIYILYATANDWNVIILYVSMHHQRVLKNTFLVLYTMFFQAFIRYYHFCFQ